MHAGLINLPLTEAMEFYNKHEYSFLAIDSNYYSTLRIICFNF